MSDHAVVGPAAYGASLKAAELDRRTVGTEAEALGQSVERFTAVLSELEGRLAPVLRPPRDEPEAQLVATRPGDASGLADNLSATDDSLCEQLHRLRKLIDRIDL